MNNSGVDVVIDPIFKVNISNNEGRDTKSYYTSGSFWFLQNILKMPTKRMLMKFKT